MPASFAPKPLALLCAGIALSGLMPTPPAAQEAQGPNIDLTLSKAQGTVATLALAHELFALGRAQGDALVVLAAARLAAPVATEPGPERKVTTSGEASTAPATEPMRPADAGGMFDLALTLAGQDPYLTEVILDARDAAGRGRIGGAYAHSASVTPGRTDSWEIPFTGGAYAELAVIGAGLSDLDILVTDENGNVICRNGGAADALYCDFVPSWDGFFYIAVENRGLSATGYSLVTN